MREDYASQGPSIVLPTAKQTTTVSVVPAMPRGDHARYLKALVSAAIIHWALGVAIGCVAYKLIFPLRTGRPDWSREDQRWAVDNLAGGLPSGQRLLLSTTPLLKPGSCSSSTASTTDGRR